MSLEIERHKAHHRLHVVDALMRGEQVPDEVLADYPDLTQHLEPTERETGRDLFEHLSEPVSLLPPETPTVHDTLLDAPLADLLATTEQERSELLEAIGEALAAKKAPAQ